MHKKGKIFTQLLLAVSILFSTLTFGQNYLSDKEVDSIYRKYTSFEQTLGNRKEKIKEIDALLPRIRQDSVKLALINRKVMLYGSNIQDQPQVLRSHMEAKDLIYRMSSNTEDKIMVHLYLAETYSHLKMFDMVTEQLDHAEKLIEQDKSKKDISQLLMMCRFFRLGSLYDMKKYNAAISFANKLLKDSDLHVSLGPEFGQMRKMISHHYLGLSNLELKNYREAKQNIRTAIHMDDVALQDFRMRNNNAYARIFLETKKPDSALLVLNSFTDLPQVDAYPPGYIARYSILASAFSALGNQNEYRINAARKDSMQVAYAEQERLAIERSMKFLLEENLVKERNMNLWIWITLPLLLLLLLLAGFYYTRKNRDKKRFELIIADLQNENKQNIGEDPQISTEDITVKSGSPSLSSETEQEILCLLSKFESTNGFTDPNISLAKLATKLKTNTTYLSEIINRCKGKNFNNYINELRIYYVINKLYNEPEYRNYKISYLAQESGFISHSTFATVFKNVLGVSPSSFISQLKDNSK